MPSLVRHLAGTVGRPVPLRLLRARVAGRTVVVTGASRGVGAEVARVLGLAGADVVLVARGAEGLERTAHAVRAAGGTATTLPLDLRDADATDAAASALAARSPAVLVSNAGHSIRRSLADSVDRAHDLRRLAGVNLLGPVALALPIVDAMARAGDGHVVHVGSASSVMPTPGWAAYAASKAGMEAWLQSAAPELRGRGIVVTSVRLPLVRTAMASAYVGSRAPSLSAQEAASLVLRAIVDRPRIVAPWWSRVGGALTGFAPVASERLAARGPLR